MVHGSSPLRFLLFLEFDRLLVKIGRSWIARNSNIHWVILIKIDKLYVRILSSVSSQFFRKIKCRNVRKVKMSKYGKYAVRKKNGFFYVLISNNMYVHINKRTFSSNSKQSEVLNNFRRIVQPANILCKL